MAVTRWESQEIFKVFYFLNYSFKKEVTVRHVFRSVEMIQ